MKWFVNTLEIKLNIFKIQIRIAFVVLSDEIGFVFARVIFLMPLAYHFIASFLDDEIHDLPKNRFEFSKVFFIEIDFVFLIVKRSVFVGEFFAFSDRKVIVTCLGFSDIKKISAAPSAKHF